MAVAAAGAVFVLGLLAVAPDLREILSAAPPAEARQPIDESAESAERFLASAQQSLAAGDYELAALQLQKAVQELESAGASAARIDPVLLMLAEARVQDGELAAAQELCQRLAGGSLKAEASSLNLRIEKAQRQKAQDLLASGRQDLRAGRLTPAMQKAREVEKIFRSSGGSAEQISKARSLLADAQRIEAGKGLQRPRQPVPDGAVGLTPERRARQRRVRRHLDPGGYSEPAPPPPRDRSGDLPPRLILQDTPMADALRRGRRPQAPAPVEGGGGEIPSEAPPQGLPSEASAAPGPALPPSAPLNAESRRGRAGSQDVLPTYNSQGGGSVY
jgi:hypothetical protein